jgi:hypothetical protein
VVARTLLLNYGKTFSSFMVKNILILLILRLKNLLVFLTIKKTEIPGKKLYKKIYILYLLYFYKYQIFIFRYFVNILKIFRQISSSIVGRGCRTCQTVVYSVPHSIL